jgi:prepilin-type processing-associated H-X9-DG protein
VYYSSYQRDYQGWEFTQSGQAPPRCSYPCMQIEGRHNGKFNILFCDGSVESNNKKQLILEHKFTEADFE